MKSFSVEVLNPKALKLLKDLADMKLISLNEKSMSFEKLLKELRKRGKQSNLSEEDILDEVKSVRANRYANKK